MAKPTKPAPNRRNKGKTSSKPGESAQAHAFLMDTLKAQEPAEAAGSAERAPPPPKPQEPEEKRPLGRPSECTPEVQEEVLERIAEGEYLEDICKDAHMPSRRCIQRYRRSNDVFRRAYACAREAQMEALEYKAISVARDGSNDFIEVEQPDGSKKRTVNHEHIARSKLIVEQYRWTMSKLAPAIYGERMALDVTDATPLADILTKAKARRQALANGEEPADVRKETAH